MSERGKLLLQPGFLATHVKTDYERKKNEWIKRNNEIRKSHEVKNNATPFMDDDDNESVSFEQEAIEMPPGHRNVRGHRDTPSPPQSVTPSPTQGLTSSPHTPSPFQNVIPSPTQELTSSPHTPSPPQNVTPSPTQGLTSSPPQGLTSSPPQGLIPSPHTPSPHQSGTPSPPQGLTSSTPPIVAQSSQVNDAGPSSSKRVRGPTVGKSLDKFIAHHEGKKLVVTVPEEMKAFCGVNATMAATDLGVQIRRFCPIQGFAHSWKSVDPMAKKAILQSNRDKFDIVDGTEGNSLADAVTDNKASLLYKDWKCNMRRHYRKLRKAKVDPYSSPYPGMHMDDWKYLIDKVFKDPKIRKRCIAGKKNRKKLPFNHTMGSKSFPAAMSIEALNFDAVLRDTPTTYAIVEFFAHCSMLLDCIYSHALLYVVCPNVPFDVELQDVLMLNY
ncbi:hypothetical protein RHGRI_031270 [Rhododendron griersonianum]|uniref:Transposase n=1 Tax=Rhododendron griersonianum TaxID=479676 RepID=A0AAV6IBY4_9ERIC|nr:hypothetical protein RHGRI_031270 [Rhododendron griersonianum]